MSAKYPRRGSLKVTNELDGKIEQVASPRNQSQQPFVFKALIISKDRYQHVTKTLALWLKLHRGLVNTIEDISTVDQTSYDLVFFDLAVVSER
jgi:predicted transcriptional regulator